MIALDDTFWLTDGNSSFIPLLVAPMGYYSLLVHCTFIMKPSNLSMNILKLQISHWHKASGLCCDVTLWSCTLPLEAKGNIASQSSQAYHGNAPTDASLQVCSIHSFACPSNSFGVSAKCLQKHQHAVSVLRRIKEQRLWSAPALGV